MSDPYLITAPLLPTLQALGLTRVAPDAPHQTRKAVYVLARNFRRESHYDFIQYSPEAHDEKTEAFVWAASSWHPASRQHRAVAIGACCFQWRIYTDVPAEWAMSWIWFHPFERHRGHLTRAWPTFVERFAPFAVEGPLSPAMSAFLDLHNVLVTDDRADRVVVRPTSS